MTIEQFRRYQEQSFDAFCKMVIRNEAINEHKRIAARIQREIPLSTVSHAELSSLRYEDTYHPYKKTYYVQGRPIHVFNQALGEALQYLSPQRRDVILLTYFWGYSDADIAQLLRISCPAVHDRKKAALKKLKELLEVIRDV